MNKSLTDVIFASEKRKKVLLLLQGGKKDINFLLEHLKTKRTSLLPQLRIMEQNNIVSHYGSNYELTRIGKLLADEVKPFLETLETLDKGNSYFSTHNIDGIPEQFLKRIREIKDFVLIEPDHVDAQKLNAEYLAEALGSKEVYFVFTFMHPGTIPVLQQLLDNNINISVIDSKELTDKLVNEMPDRCQYFLSFDNLRIHSYSKSIGVCSLTVTDNGFLLRLLFNNNEFSNKQIVCMSPEGRKWGKDLHDYYEKDATLITEI
ncbi:helix-turn-helix transcriptional regulator [Methanolobus bombayensis]|uniref:helix-turn-helix transcriptional regulator n=1 Tax=Methanolobus bombayensis TaxID=38023 RepID=UPI001AE19D15|nr:winged helix-turn-helix domain-containing protein [Methanolobus bombayensis]MBP1908476.1 putative transcriptional regulator [Methanolobus bombayensis]